MSPAQEIALMRYNARRCEKSRGPICRCRCGGRFHGQAHPGQWLEENAEQIRQAWETALAQVQPKLPGVTT